MDKRKPLFRIAKPELASRDERSAAKGVCARGGVGESVVCSDSMVGPPVRNFFLCDLNETNAPISARISGPPITSYLRKKIYSDAIIESWRVRYSFLG